MKPKLAERQSEGHLWWSQRKTALELVGSCFDPTSVLGTVGVRGPVDYTVVHGRVTVEHGHLVTVDEEKLAHDAEAKCRAYLNR